MLLTAILFAKKAKSKHILVAVDSLVSGHRIPLVRERLADKLEFIAFDPYVSADVVYREVKKIRSIKKWVDRKAGYYSQFL